MSDQNDYKEPAVVGVSFRRGGKVYHFAPNGVRVQPGEHVLASTERGVDIGEVVLLKDELEPGREGAALKPLVRRATRDDLRREDRLKERESEASTVCARKISEHGLPMKLVSADYTFDGQRLTFFFSAEGRVDFRALVRDLAEIFQCRIELRQIGVRDEAKMIGGLGPCGRPLCCAQWLRGFDPVGIRVAKDQGLSLNPAKISGICDRLMCCLRFEQEMYKDLSARLPKVGDKVRGQGQSGQVKAVALLQERVTVALAGEDGRPQMLEVEAKDLRRSRGEWLLLTGAGSEPLAAGVGPADRAKTTVTKREPRGGRKPEAPPVSKGEPGRQAKSPAKAPAKAPAKPETSEADERPRTRRRPRRRGRSRRPAKDANEARTQTKDGASGGASGEGKPQTREGGRAPKPPADNKGKGAAPAGAQPSGSGEKPKRRKWRRRPPRRNQGTDKPEKPTSE